VKWLYPGAEDSSEVHQVSDMESELQTDQSIQGSEMDKSSPTSSGADVDTFSSDDLPQDKADPLAEIGQKMTAASSYVGSLLQTSWYSTGTTKEKEEKPADDSAPKEKDEKQATGSSTSFFQSSWYPGGGSSKDKDEKSAANSFSSAFFNTIGKVSGSHTGSEQPTTEDAQKEEGEEAKQEEGKEKDAAAGSGFGYLTSAFSKIGISGLTGSTSTDQLEDKEHTTGEKAEQEQNGEKENKQIKDGQPDFFSSAFSKVGKAASTYTKVLQDSVSKAPMLADFNQEQENFIKSKGEKDIPTAPWSGYQKRS